MDNIKTSKILNELLGKIIKEFGYYTTIYDYSDDIDANIILVENDARYRACDFMEYVEEGIDIIQKSAKTGLPIYRVFNESDDDVILYFCDNIENIKNKLKAVLEKVKQDNEESSEEEIRDLEFRLKEAKKKIKK